MPAWSRCHWTSRATFACTSSTTVSFCLKKRSFCHMEIAPDPVIEEIAREGFAIIDRPDGPSPPSLRLQSLTCGVQQRGGFRSRSPSLADGRIR